MSNTLLLEPPPSRFDHLEMEREAPPVVVSAAEAAAITAGMIASTVISDAKADSLIDALASMDERQRRIKAQAEAMCREIDNERKGLLFVHETDLREWCQSKLKGKARSVKRLVGTVGFRTVPGRVVVTDPDAALEWCRTYNRDAIREALDPKKLLAHDDLDIETGELVKRTGQGCEWVAERTSFYVKGCKAESEVDDE